MVTGKNAGLRHYIHLLYTFYGSVVSLVLHHFRAKLPYSYITIDTFSIRKKSPSQILVKLKTAPTFTLYFSPTCSHRTCNGSIF